MSKFVLLSFMMSTFCLSSCNEKVDPIEAAKAEMMKIHDDSMAEIGKVRSYALRLEALLPKSEDSTKINEIISELEIADEEMMLWMYNYSEPKEGLMKYYEDQKKEITIVADKIYSSLNKAKSFFNE